MDAETAATRESNEVNNGRLAMLAFWELVRHDITMDAGEPLDLLLIPLRDSLPLTTLQKGVGWPGKNYQPGKTCWPVMER